MVDDSEKIEDVATISAKAADAIVKQEVVAGQLEEASASTWLNEPKKTAEVKTHSSRSEPVKRGTEVLVGKVPLEEKDVGSKEELAQEIKPKDMKKSEVKAKQNHDELATKKQKHIYQKLE